VLRPLTESDEAQALLAHRELAADDFTFLLGWSPERTWSQYLRLLQQHRHGLELEPGHVPATFLVAQVGGDLVGRVSIRHELNDFLAEFGGHIGYAVRPQCRRRGHATEILRQSLVVARGEGVERVLVVRRRQLRLTARHRAVRRSPPGRTTLRQRQADGALLDRLTVRQADLL